MADRKLPNKATLTALGHVFGAEISGRLPFQSKAKIYAALMDQGYLEPMKRTFGRGPLAVEVVGYELTHLGRITYCDSCDGEDDV